MFSLDDEGKITVAGDGAVADEDAAAVEDAVELCPVQALEIVR